MPAPQVRDLQTLIDEYSKSFDPQRQVLQSEMAANDNAGQAQIAGLDAKKTTAFQDINQEANNKGMYFSGFTPEEEAKYTAGTYLPALAQLQATIASTRNSLLGKQAELDSQARTSALDARQNDINSVNSWNNMEEQARLTAEESAKQRQFDAEQNAQKIAADNARAAADRAATAASQPSNAELFAANFAKSAGNDGKVSPGTFQALKHQWVTAGYGSASDFTSKFWKFANPSHWWDYYYG